MKKIILTVLLALSTACGTDLESINNHIPETMDKIQSPLRSATKFFMNYCATTDKAELCERNFKLLTSARIDKTEGTVAGFCSVGLRTGRRHIVVGNRFTPKYQYWIMMHELGHCILDADHVPEGDKVHIMNPFLAHISEYKQPHVIPDLFNIVVPISYNLAQEEDVVTYHLKEDKSCDKHTRTRP